MRLSYSKLQTYRQCALRYRLTYLDRLPRRPRRLFRAARRVHAALMRWLVYARRGEPLWSEVEQAYRLAWGVALPAEADRDYAEGLALLRQFHEANRGRPCTPVLLEHRFQVQVGTHLLTGAVDRVDALPSGYEVIDYKLDREPRTQAEVDTDLQLGLYHLALERGEGIRADALTLYFLRGNHRRTTTRSPGQAAELARWVEHAGDSMERARHFAPCAGPHCAGCDFRALCPEHGGTLLAAPPRPAGQLALPPMERDAPPRSPQLTLPFAP